MIRSIAQASEWGTIHKTADIDAFADEIHTFNPRSLSGLQQKIRGACLLHGWFNQEMSNAIVNNNKRSHSQRGTLRLQQFMSQLEPHFTTRFQDIIRSIVRHSHFTDAKKHEVTRPVALGMEKDSHSHAENNKTLQRAIGEAVLLHERIVSELRVDVAGETMSVADSEMLERSPHRAESAEVWKARQETHLKASEVLHPNFSSLLEWRKRMTHNDGYDHPLQEAYSAPFHWRESDAHAFIKHVPDNVLPTHNNFIEHHQQRLGRTHLMPFDHDPAWNATALARHEEQLNPYEHANELLENISEVLHLVRPQYSQWFEDEEIHEIDLYVRGNAAFSFCVPNYMNGTTYTKMSLVKSHTDIEDLTHEIGHGVTSRIIQCLPIEFRTYLDPGLTITEIPALAMEYFCASYWNRFYDKEQHIRAIRRRLEESVQCITRSALFLEFQKEITTDPQHTASEYWGDCFVQLMEKHCSPLIHWDRLARYKRNYWQQQADLFDMPFSDLDVGMAELAALQFYEHYLEDPKETIRAFERGHRLWSRGRMRDIYKAWGLDFVRPSSKQFPRYLQKRMGFVEKQWNNPKIAPS